MNKIREAAERAVQSGNIQCPHCGLTIPAVVGRSICDYCQREVEVILNGFPVENDMFPYFNA
jgi:hypothetical protein